MTNKIINRMAHCEKKFVNFEYCEVSSTVAQARIFADVLHIFLDYSSINSLWMKYNFQKMNNLNLFMDDLKHFYSELFPHSQVDEGSLKNGIFNAYFQKTSPTDLVKLKDSELSLSISKDFDANVLFGIDLGKIKTLKITLPENCDETVKKKVHFLLMSFLIWNVANLIKTDEITVFCKDEDTINDLMTNSYGAPMPNSIAELLWDDNGQFIGASISLAPKDFPNFKSA